MPLNPVVLSTELMRIFRAQISDPAVIASQQADAYALYARDATAGGTLPAFIGTETTLMKPILYGALAVPKKGGPVVYASAWSLAIASFWALPPVAFAGPSASGVSAVPTGLAVLVPTLAAAVSVPVGVELSATGIAAALHAATLTVIVTGVLTSGGPFSAPLT